MRGGAAASASASARVLRMKSGLVPALARSAASDRTAGIPGSGRRAPKALAAAEGRASAVTPPCGHPCYCRHNTTPVIHKRP